MQLGSGVSEKEGPVLLALTASVLHVPASGCELLGSLLPRLVSFHSQTGPCPHASCQRGLVLTAVGLGQGFPSLSVIPPGSR